MQYETEDWNGKEVTPEEVKEWVETILSSSDKQHMIYSGDTVVFKIGDNAVLEAKITKYHQNYPKENQ
jgi:hypothetical protein